VTREKRKVRREETMTHETDRVLGLNGRSFAVAKVPIITRPAQPQEMEPQCSRGNPRSKGKGSLGGRQLCFLTFQNWDWIRVGEWIVDCMIREKIANYRSPNPHTVRAGGSVRDKRIANEFLRNLANSRVTEVRGVGGGKNAGRDVSTLRNLLLGSNL